MIIEFNDQNICAEKAPKCPTDNPWPETPVLDNKLYEQLDSMDDSELTDKNKQLIQQLVDWFHLYSSKHVRQLHGLNYLGEVYKKIGDDLGTYELANLDSIGKLVDNRIKHKYLVQDQRFLGYWLKYFNRYLSNDCPLEAYNSAAKTMSANQLVRQLGEIRQKLFEAYDEYLDEEKSNKDQSFWVFLSIDQKILNYLKNTSLLDKTIQQLTPESLKLKTLQILLIDTELLYRGYSAYKT
ncbi:uncharacterized protein LOC128953403 [Oppia nitens]|uniref:uncharacterized protein LOC128953403 n=1 Tax=Oppia nitens TaxID=1686743 RepID=UPI0023DB16C1|nr:uncharacterized protein LOC128953403 [Oppia nitens]